MVLMTMTMLQMGLLFKVFNYLQYPFKINNKKKLTEGPNVFKVHINGPTKLSAVVVLV